MSNGSNIVSFEDARRASRASRAARQSGASGASSAVRKSNAPRGSKTPAKGNPRANAKTASKATSKTSTAKAAPKVSTAKAAPKVSATKAARKVVPKASATKAASRITAKPSFAGARSQKARIRKLSTKALMRAVAVVIACFAIFCAATYGPAKQCYYQVREKDRLAAEYAAVVERNDTLTNNVETLESAQGIEDAARNSFGYVASDEESGSVIGLDLEEDSTFTAKILSGSVSAPDTWYSGVLDWVFGYES